MDPESSELRRLAIFLTGEPVGVSASDVVGSRERFRADRNRASLGANGQNRDIHSMTISKLCLVTGLAILLAIGPSPLSGLAAADDQVLARGQFVGKKGHKTSGGVAVVKTAKGMAVVLEPDFSFDGAPDPKLGFGRNGYDPASQFSALKANQGTQRYEIPESLTPGAYNEIWVWCERYSVPLGVAKLR
jgi:hypothetical protein